MNLVTREFSVAALLIEGSRVRWSLQKVMIVVMGEEHHKQIL